MIVTLMSLKARIMEAAMIATIDIITVIIAITVITVICSKVKRRKRKRMVILMGMDMVTRTMRTSKKKTKEIKHLMVTFMGITIKAVRSKNRKICLNNNPSSLMAIKRRFVLRVMR